MLTWVEGHSEAQQRYSIHRSRLCDPSATRAGCWANRCSITQFNMVHNPIRRSSKQSGYHLTVQFRTASSCCMPRQEKLTVHKHRRQQRDDSTIMRRAFELKSDRTRRGTSAECERSSQGHPDSFPCTCGSYLPISSLEVSCWAVGGSGQNIPFAVIRIAAIASSRDTEYTPSLAIASCAAVRRERVSYTLMTE